MSIECSNVVWSRNFNGSSRKMVAVKLADHADDEGRGIWPSVEKIAAKCDLSCRTVQRVLSDFVREGILKVVSEGGNGPRDTRRYDFDLAVVRALPLAVAPADSRAESRAVKPENKGDTVSPLAETMGDTDGAKGDIDDKMGDTVSPKPSITIIEPSLERESASEDEAREESGKTGERAFKRTFALWPTFVSDSEPAARKAWDGLATEERSQAIERQADYVASVRTSGRSKFCTFGVYLAEKRWEKLAPKVGSDVGPKPAAPFGKAWVAAFLRIVTTRAGPLPALSPFDQRRVEADPDLELALRRERQITHGWPAASRMLEKLREHRPAFVDPAVGRLGTDFQQVRRGSAVDRAWDRLAAARGIPWLPEHRPDWIWLPALPGGAEALSESELDQAVAAAFDDFKRRIGHEHAA
ncbi:MAG: helix-turn-helix domain-containing protein [Rhizobium sp.]|nr:helix-turn-helix domain-containing protein [Rhizobium sp.]